MLKLLSHRSYPQQSLTDKQASLPTSYLASIPGLYSYMRAPPFQETWNVTLGGRAQDLRGAKFCARDEFQTDRSSMRLPKRQAKKSPGGCQGFFGCGQWLIVFTLGEGERQTGHLARVV